MGNMYIYKCKEVQVVLVYTGFVILTSDFTNNSSLQSIAGTL